MNKEVGDWIEAVWRYIDAMAEFSHLYTNDNGLVFCYTFRGRKYGAHFFMNGKSLSRTAIAMEKCYRLRCLLDLIELSFDALKKREALNCSFVSSDVYVAITECVDEWPITDRDTLLNVVKTGTRLSHAD